MKNNAVSCGHGTSRALSIPALLLLFVAAGCTGGGETKKGGGGRSQARAEKAIVEVLKVKAVDAKKVIYATGSVQTRENVKVAPQVGGRLVSILVKEGGDVQGGQELFILDEAEGKLRIEQAQKALEAARKRVEQLEVVAAIEEKTLALGVEQSKEALKQMIAREQAIKTGARPQEIKQLKAVVDMARTKVDAAGREVDRMRGLADSDVIPRQSFEQLEDSLKLAQAQYRQSAEQLRLLQLGAREEDREAMEAAVQQAAKALEVAKASQGKVEATRIELATARLGVEQAAASLELATLNAAYNRVKAPVSGRIEEIMVREGTVVGAGTALALLVPSARAEIVVRVKEEDREQIGIGMQVGYRLDAYPKGGPFAGKVLQVATVADPSSGLFPVRIEPEEGHRGGLTAGMFARCEIETGVKKGALMVPVASVMRMEGRKVLYVVEEGLARKRYVETGLRYPELVEVVEGLAEGELLVVDGQVGLVDGIAAEVRSSSQEAVAQ